MIYDRYYYLLEKKLNSLFSDSNLNPAELYSPQQYIISLGGKRLRPLLALISADLFGVDFRKAMPAALCVELFHNFSLIHDDILDKAPLRRGKQTVHKKWNTDIAILSGDAMLVRAYIELNQAESNIKDKLIRLFNKTAIEVCEGQQEDMNFESMEHVSVDQYTSMITKKTAVLLACGLEMGAISANASDKDCRLIYNCGKHLGIAFQLKDDVLDVFADQKMFGKQTGGDIISNKKTFLLLKAIALANKKQRADLKNWISKKKFSKKEKVKAIIHIYNQLNIKEISENEINKHFNSALRSLDKIKNIDTSKKENFRKFCIDLMLREK